MTYTDIHVEIAPKATTVRARTSRQEEPAASALCGDNRTRADLTLTAEGTSVHPRETVADTSFSGQYLILLYSNPADAPSGSTPWWITAIRPG